MFRGFRCCTSMIGMVVLVLLAAYAYFTFLRAPVSGPPPAAGTSSSPAQGFDSRLAAFDQAVRQNASAGKQVPVSLTISQDELATRVNHALSSGETNVPVSAVQVTILAGQVLVKGQVQAGPVSAPLSLTAQPQVVNGQPRMSVQSVDFGPFPVPQWLRDRIISAVGGQDLLGDLPLTVTAFRAEPGRLVLEGTTKPG